MISPSRVPSIFLSKAKKSSRGQNSDRENDAVKHARGHIQVSLGSGSPCPNDGVDKLSTNISFIMRLAVE
jgi:hypothetical protein